MKTMLIECDNASGPTRLIFDFNDEINALDATLPTIVESGKAFRIVDSRGVSVCVNPAHFVRAVTIPDAVKVDDVFGWYSLGGEL